MPAPRTQDELHAAIDLLLLDYLGEVRRSVATRMMEGQWPPGDRGLRSHQPQMERSGRSRAPSNRGQAKARRGRTRRSSAELHEIGLKFVGLVRENPGMGMTYYARELGVSSKELWRPSVIMRKENLIRAIGAKGATKYFPVYA